MLTSRVHCGARTPTHKEISDMSYSFDTLGPLRLAYIHASGPLHEIPDAFSQLMEWAALAGLDVLDEMSMVLVRDEPGEALGSRTTYDAAITVGPDVEGTSVIGIEELPASKYAVKEHDGGYDSLAEELGTCTAECDVEGLRIAEGPAIIFLDEVVGEAPDERVTARVYIPVVAEAGEA
jgi:DNA gyrase inhibitor GyrI